MRPILLILSACIVLSAFSGCRSKKELELYRPGDTQVWRTVDVGPRTERAVVLPRVELDTSMGRLVVELYEREAPASVANFLLYVEDGFYDGTIFHRVEPGLVIQGGGYTAELQPKETRPPIRNEAGNGLRNLRGTLGMARTMAMDSATSQFYINLVDNPGFNGDGVTSGYAVFGRVVEGMDVVDAIARVERVSDGRMNTLPAEPVLIQGARRLP